MLGERLLLLGGSLIPGTAIKSPNPRRHEEWFFFVVITALIALLAHTQAFAGTRIPGADASEKLEAAGTLLRIVGTSGIWAIHFHRLNAIGMPTSEQRCT